MGQTPGLRPTSSSAFLLILFEEPDPWGPGSRCTTKAAPWFVIPSDRKWFRNHAAAEIIVRTPESFKMRYPKPDEKYKSGVLT